MEHDSRVHESMRPVIDILFVFFCFVPGRCGVCGTRVHESARSVNDKAGIPSQAPQQRGTMESEHVLHKFRNFFGIHSQKYFLNIFFPQEFQQRGTLESEHVLHKFRNLEITFHEFLNLEIQKLPFTKYAEMNSL